MAQLRSALWRETLDREAPWWAQMADAAIVRLSGPVPESHHKKEIKESRLSWFSGDPILNALELLDDLLAIDPSPPFDALQRRLVETIISKWPEWPPFTKASAFSCLRTWFWHPFPPMRSLLVETITSDPHPVVVRYAVDRLVELAWAASASELPAFVRRAAPGGHGDALRRVSYILGEAVVRRSLPLQGQRVSELEEFFWQALDLEWRDAEALSDYLDGALAGATDYVKGEGARPPALEKAWLRVVDAVAVRWPFENPRDADGERFPVHTLLSVIEAEGSPEVRARLFLGLARAFEAILRGGDLAAFCSLHFELKGLIAGRSLPVREGREWRDGLPMSEPLEETFAALCRASVERIAAWKREGKTTDDLGWRSGLDGRESAELVKCCLDVSRDRERMKRALIPLTDILADAGEKRVAAELRAYLRNR